MKRNRKRILIFQPAIAPYRIDFFNELHDRLGAKLILYRDNPEDQEFDKSNTFGKLHFKPGFFSKSLRLFGRDYYIGHFRRLFYYRPETVIAGEYGEGLWSAVIYKRLINRKCKVYSLCDDTADIVKECTGLRRLSRDHVIKHIDGLILCNKGAKSVYDKVYGINSFVFPIIHRSESFYEDRGEAENIARRYLQEYSLTGKKLFLFVGRLSAEKNLEYLIRSFVRAHDKHPSNHLILIGGDNRMESGYGDKLKGLVEQYGAEEYIKFVGRKEGTELKAWMYLCQCLVLPSYHEAFGAVVGEALLAGEYVMVSTKAGAVDLVNSDENSEFNGIAIDINKEYIDFDLMSERIDPLDMNWKPKKGGLIENFDTLMDEFVQWL